MGIWNIYFITKLYFYFTHCMGFHAWLNIAFAVFLSVPISEHYARLKPVKQIIAIPTGIVLFYYDTWLPPISRVFSQIPQLEGFSLSYLAELAGRFFNPLIIGGLILLILAYYFTRRKYRISSFVFLVMLAPLFSIGQGRPPQPEAAGAIATGSIPSPATDDAILTRQLKAFYRDEAERTVSFSPPSKSETPFDIIFLHVCSLSWDDLDFTQQRDHPLFKRFDIVFTNFNSAASYSGPAAIRLLRGSCGQPIHKALYDTAPAQCLTMDNMRQIGFDQQLAMNHDGHYGGFLDDVRKGGGLNSTPFGYAGIPTYLQSFDGSPVYDDYAVLLKWWEKRVQSTNERVVLFYNSISLHDGNYYSGRRTNSMEIYTPRLTRFLDDMDRFFSVLQASGKRVVVVFVAEHGASIRGDRMQIAGLREIPSPRITIVPVGIKLIGMPDNPAATPFMVTMPTSYLAVSQLLANFVAVTPFGKSNLSMEDYVRDLPATEFVSENEDVVVMRHSKQYFIQAKDADWVEYDVLE